MSADSAGKLTVTMDSVDQHAMGIPCGDVELKGDAFTYDGPSVGSFSGTVSKDGKSLDGTWSHHGSSSAAQA
jgi:serine-type D-Ala-D-Ala carboxypeptidase/endopeptidase